jgi:DNA-binding FadR family transcriptional regulator
MLDRSAITAVGDALDVAAARSAAEHRTEEDLDVVLRATRSRDGGDPAGDELAFRRAVAAASHNPLLTVLVDAVAGLGAAGLAAPGHFPGAAAQRRDAVAAAIGDRDPERAEGAMRELIGRPAPPGTRDG